MASLPMFLLFIGLLLIVFGYGHFRLRAKPAEELLPVWRPKQKEQTLLTFPIETVPDNFTVPSAPLPFPEPLSSDNPSADSKG